jgi:hypothetical protein
MKTFWEKFVFGTKLTIFGLVALYAILFIAANWGVNVPDIHLIVLPEYKDVWLLKVLFIDSVVSIFGWWLFWAVYRTVRRIKAASAARTDAMAAPAPASSSTAQPSSSAPNSGGNAPFTPPK